MGSEKVNLDADGLTLRQAKFVQHYASGKNGAHAVIAAGFSEKGASAQAVRLLAMMKVKAALAKITKLASDRAETDAEWVLRRLKAEALLLEGSEKNSASRLKALELIGKHNRLFVDRIEHSGSITVIVDTGVPRD